MKVKRIFESGSWVSIARLADPQPTEEVEFEGVAAVQRAKDGKCVSVPIGIGTRKLFSGGREDPGSCATW